MTTTGAPQTQLRGVGRRERRYYVRVTPEQDLKLQQLAGAQNVTVPRLLVDSTLGAPRVPPKVLALELAGVRRILTGEATNLNQIARSANRGAVTAEEIEAALDSIRWRDLQLAEVFGRVR